MSKGESSAPPAGTKAPSEPDYGRLSKFINDIGIAIVDEVDPPSKRSFLFAHVADGWADVHLFTDRGAAVQTYPPGRAIPALLLELWKAENAGRPAALRWSYLEYDVRGAKVSVRFVYPEQIKPGTRSEELLDKALRKRFRTKPMVDEAPPEIDAPITS